MVRPAFLAVTRRLFQSDGLANSDDVQKRMMTVKTEALGSMKRSGPPPVNPRHFRPSYTRNSLNMIAKRSGTDSFGSNSLYSGRPSLAATSKYYAAGVCGNS